ncbi:P-loop containing nucleoside triphosphate hydrolase protein [Xylariaceae sp. FL1651]|nr:P-loop containing nucleoside triphosphate hydrolase protein [Xylariaceae sp. FL1651]
METIETNIDNLDALVKSLEQAFIKSQEDQEPLEAFGLLLKNLAKQIPSHVAYFQKQVELFSSYNIELSKTVDRLQTRLDNLKEDASKGEQIASESRPFDHIEHIDLELQLESAHDEVERLKIALANSESERKADFEQHQMEIEACQEQSRQYEEAFDGQSKYVTQLKEAKKADELAKETFRIRYRELFEELVELKGSIRVMCRIRPAGENRPAGELVQFSNPDGTQSYLPWARLQVTTEEPRTSYHAIETKSNTYQFERVFGSGETNEDIFREIRDFAQSALLGKPITILAYGQTGSGKSYTFLSDNGLLPRYINLLFQLADRDREEYKYTFELAAVEVQLNKIYDLLQAPARGQKIQVRVDKQTFALLSSEESAIDLLKKAIRRRETAPTGKNQASSRSHFVVSVKLSRRPISGSEADKPIKGIVSFADLGGAEKSGKERSTAPGVNPAQDLLYNQGVDINTSLRELDLAIQAVSKNQPVTGGHSLIKVLKPSLSSNSRLLMMVMVSPLKEDLQQTLGTLAKGQEAMKARKTSNSGKGSSLPRPETPSSRNPNVANVVAAEQGVKGGSNSLSRAKEGVSKIFNRGNSRVSSKIPISSSHPPSSPLRSESNTSGRAPDDSTLPTTAPGTQTSKTSRIG